MDLHTSTAAFFEHTPWAELHGFGFHHFSFCRVRRNDVHNKALLDVTGVEHDADSAAKSLAGEVLGELGADTAAVAVVANDAAPDGAVLAAIDLALGLVDVGNALAHVEGGILELLDALHPQDGGVVLLGGVAAALEAHELGLGVQPTYAPQGRKAGKRRVEANNG